MPEATLVEAINLALARAMEDDPDVVVLGEDVGASMEASFVRPRGCKSALDRSACSIRRCPSF